MILKTFKDIQVVFLDVDGVLTDGTILVPESGEQLRTFNVKDGYAMQMANKKGLELIVITGGRSIGVKKRLEGLGIKEVHLHVSDKLSLMLSIAKERGFDLEKCMFVGDDVPDYACMERVGLAACPRDAVEDIKEDSDYISPYDGGKGVVRDVLEKCLKLKGLWPLCDHTKSI